LDDLTGRAAYAECLKTEAASGGLDGLVEGDRGVKEAATSPQQRSSLGKMNLRANTRIHMIRNLIKRIPGARKAYRTLRPASAPETPPIAQQYLRSAGVKKLHLGCGRNVLEGWLNSDFYPTQAHVMHLDATEAFPLPPDSFDYIFSEHMIEHLKYGDGFAMLKESYRILKPGGRVRISTPDLKFLIDLYSEPKTPLQTEYIKWATETFTKTSDKIDTIVINNFVRDWGHLFIYDPKTLTHSLESAGFTAIERFAINESNDPALMDLENASRMPPGFLQLESFTLEATKPKGNADH
jgi:predicted SAM-dependent methyltransferase